MDYAQIIKFALANNIQAKPIVGYGNKTITYLADATKLYSVRLLRGGLYKIQELKPLCIKGSVYYSVINSSTGSRTFRRLKDLQAHTLSIRESVAAESSSSWYTISQCQTLVRSLRLSLGYSQERYALHYGLETSDVVQAELGSLTSIKKVLQRTGLYSVSDERTQLNLTSK